MALPIAGQVLDATTGIPSMVHDLQTLTDSHASTADKLTAGADLPVNAASSPSTASSAQTAPAHAETIHTTANHPWLTVDRGWVAAGDLHAGEGIVTLDGAAATVAWVRAVPGQADRYNLTVAQDHTYAVGASRAVVHNTCGRRRYFPNRKDALQAAEEHVGFPLNSSEDDGVTRLLRDELNPDAKMPSRYPGEYYQNPGALGERWDPESNVRAYSPEGAQIFEHPFGHNDIGAAERPAWHNYGHIHATNAAGVEDIYWYGPELDVTRNG